MTAGKPWYRSRVVWWNVATGVVALATMVPDMLVQFAVEEVLAETIRTWAFFANLAGNVVLRFVTVEPIRKGRP